MGHEGSSRQLFVHTIGNVAICGSNITELDETRQEGYDPHPIIKALPATPSLITDAVISRARQLPDLVTVTDGYFDRVKDEELVRGNSQATTDAELLLGLMSLPEGAGISAGDLLACVVDDATRDEEWIERLSAATGSVAYNRDKTAQAHPDRLDSLLAQLRQRGLMRSSLTHSYKAAQYLHTANGLQDALQAGTVEFATDKVRVMEYVRQFLGHYFQHIGNDAFRDCVRVGNRWDFIVKAPWDRLKLIATQRYTPDELASRHTMAIGLMSILSETYRAGMPEEERAIRYAHDLAICKVVQLSLPETAETL